MLSRALDDLAMYLCADGSQAVELAPEALQSLDRVLRDMANQARALECQVVPAGARELQELPDNVVALRPRQARRGDAA